MMSDIKNAKLGDKRGVA